MTSSTDTTVHHWMLPYSWEAFTLFASSSSLFFERMTPHWNELYFVKSKDFPALFFKPKNQAVCHLFISQERFNAKELKCQFILTCPSNPNWQAKQTFISMEGGIRVENTLLFASNCKEREKKAITQLWEKWAEYQKKTLSSDLKTIQSYGQASLRILISGATGFIGERLCLFLALSGHQVVPLVRKPPKENRAYVLWDPLRQEARTEDFEGFDVIIHLAGDSIAKGRWTKKRRETLIQSRVQSTQLLTQIILTLKKPPQMVIGASAIGYYGAHPKGIVDEDSPPGEDFLACLCVAWEKALQPVKRRNILVTHTRFGNVFCPSSGFLKAFLNPIQKLKLGVYFGKGDEKISWVSIDDLIYALYHILMHKEPGVFNIVAGGVVSQKGLLQVIEKLRTWFLKVSFPVFLVKLLLGKKALLVLSSQEVRAKRLKEKGFSFTYPSVREALKHLL